jgi:hypothetical protein
MRFLVLSHWCSRQSYVHPNLANNLFALLRQPTSEISSAMTTEELFQAVDWIKVTMIAVATGGPRINEVNADFAKKYDEVAKQLASRGVKNTFPYRDLWQWYERWSSGDMPSWQSRRSFVNGLADELMLNIQEASAGTVAAHEPTGWARVDRTVTEARKQLELQQPKNNFRQSACCVVRY